MSGCTAGLAFVAGTAQAQVTSDATAPVGYAIRANAAAGAGALRITPNVSIEQDGDNGVRAHTNFIVSVPVGGSGAKPAASAPSPTVGPPYSGYYYNTPASLACVYGLVPASNGCDPNKVSVNPVGGSRVIAIVDAFDNPSAAADLQTYSTQFGLPAVTSANFQVVYAAGTKPNGNTGWAEEEALDIEMAHAMAPSAKVVLVEAATNSYTDLNKAVDVATSIVAAAGGGEVSMSYGGSEFSGEVNYDSHFSLTSNTVYMASTGDTPATEWPSVSKRVVAVGGTSLSRHPDGVNVGAFRQETTWDGAGVGFSTYEPRPIFQDPIQSRFPVPSQRGVPDVAAVANPDTGVWVTCSVGCGYSSPEWFGVGGTSVASPFVTALINNAGNFFASGRLEQNKLYGEMQTSVLFDVGIGTCGPAVGYFSALGSPSSVINQWDSCTGVGAPRGLGGL